MTPSVVVHFGRIWKQESESYYRRSGLAALRNFVITPPVILIYF